MQVRESGVTTANEINLMGYVAFFYPQTDKVLQNARNSVADYDIESAICLL